MARKKAKIALWDAEHPARRAAIAVLEDLIERGVFKKEPRGEAWYTLEDALTEIINIHTK